MRIANLDGRHVLKYPDGVTDVEKASDRRFAADPQAMFARRDEFADWAGRLRAPLVEPFDPGRLKPPAPRPSQVFAIGLNDADHAAEGSLPLPPEPAVFTKFQTSITGSNEVVVLPTAQFSIGKSFPGFSPIGPDIVTPNELADRDDLEIGCSVNGEIVQRARTSDLIFSVASLIERLSAILPLNPGDLIFTGTPSGVGRLRNTFAEGPRTSRKPPESS